MDQLLSKIETALQLRPLRSGPLSGGCVGQVYRVAMADGSDVVAKVDKSGRSQLALEAKMLRYLAVNSSLPVPDVLYSDEQLLIIEFVPGSNRMSPAAQEDAADLLASLHQITAPQYGFEYDTLIGGLPQPNLTSDSWLAFFARWRLQYMAQEAVDAGRLPAPFMRRLDRFCQALDRWLEEPARPGLIHGDAWTGNILAGDRRITGFIDPAIYFADPEIELAFTTLFGTFGRPFFDRYQEIRPISPGFMEVRRDIYNLYPLLVHVRLFGGSYVASVDSTLRRFGF